VTPQPQARKPWPGQAAAIAEMRAKELAPHPPRLTPSTAERTPPQAPVAPRLLLGPLAPADCVLTDLLPGGELTRMTPTDLEGTALLELVLPSSDTVSIRCFALIFRWWLLWRHGVTRVRLMRNG